MAEYHNTTMSFHSPLVDNRKGYTIGRIEGFNKNTEYNYYSNLLSRPGVPRTVHDNMLLLLSSLHSPYWRLRIILTIINLTRLLHVKNKFLHSHIDESNLTAPKRAVSTDIWSDGLIERQLRTVVNG
jgi:hypothetical protein